MKHAIALFLALTLNAVANLMMKVGARRLGPQGLEFRAGVWPVAADLAGNWVLVLGLALFAANVVFYLYALSGIHISAAYPIMFGGGFTIIAIVAWAGLGEHMSAGQWAGVALILAGVILVARGMSFGGPAAGG